MGGIIVFQSMIDIRIFLLTLVSFLGVLFHSAKQNISHTSITPTPSITGTPSTNPTSSVKQNSFSSTPTSNPTPTMGQSAIPSMNPLSVNKNDFIYPNATQIVNSSDSSVSLTSTDDTNTITNWYKEKLKNLNFHSTAVAQTNTNGNILNKLAAVNNNGQVQIEIRKNSGDASVTINITFSNSGNGDVNIHI